MSLLKLTWRFLGAVAIIALAPVAVHAQAQDFLPIAEPMEFNPDWQWFAPIDVDELSETTLRKRGNFGWFASHDRTRTWVARPDIGPNSKFTGDFANGHKTEIGFARENGGGWLMNYTSMNGLKTYHGTVVERINRFNDDDDPNDPTGDPVFPVVDRNDPRFLARSYRVDDSLNAGSLQSFGLCKTWRRSPYRYGGILEPLIGLKYATFTDLKQDQDYQRSTNLVATPGGTTTDTQLEIFRSYETTNLNRLIGGQVGARYFTDYHKWRLSAEFRTFLTANFQTSTQVENTTQTEYDGGPGVGGDVVYNDVQSILTYKTARTTVWGFEAKADAAYQLTKYIGLRGGVSVFDMARGIQRGGINILRTSNAKNQDVFMAGMSFGIEINR
jgi:hypothetical protein